MWFPALTRPAAPAMAPDLAYGTPVNRRHDTIRVAPATSPRGSELREAGHRLLAQRRSK
ncbi:MAG TPA: hypothetical protein VFX61_14665 [Micromonosporaceae bacterium]|nr:hypothetical protein [Micromonosporaceae bacterium]